MSTESNTHPELPATASAPNVQLGNLARGVGRFAHSTARVGFAMLGALVGVESEQKSAEPAPTPKPRRPGVLPAIGRFTLSTVSVAAIVLKGVAEGVEAGNREQKPSTTFTLEDHLRYPEVPFAGDYSNRRDSM